MDYLKEKLTYEVCDYSKCWNWTGALRAGYGILNHGPEILVAHRLSYEIFCGGIPERKDDNKYVVRHGCDNPKCINPDHLLLGTQKDNMHDLVRYKIIRLQVLEDLEKEMSVFIEKSKKPKSQRDSEQDK